MDHARNTDRSELPLLETALLWAMRAWVTGHNRNINLSGRIIKMFASLKTPEAAIQLEGFMGDLRFGAKRSLDIDCVCQQGVSADEMLLLDVFALSQEAHEEEARMLLGRLLQDQAVASASCHALGLALSLNAAGHYLPRGPATVRRHAFCHLVSNHLPLPDRRALN